MKRAFIILILVLINLNMFSVEFPLSRNCRVTSGLGYRTDGFVGGQKNLHKGVDISAPEGTPVKSAFSGIVIEHWPSPTGFYEGKKIGYYRGHPDYGGMITIQDLDGKGITLYGHFSQTYVKEGDFIQEGEVIGLVGNTGKSTAPHLHVERWVDIIQEIDNILSMEVKENLQ